MATISGTLTEKTVKVNESVTIHNNEINITANEISDEKVVLNISSRRSLSQTIELSREKPQDVIFYGEGKMVINLLKIRGNMIDFNVGEWKD